MDDPDVTMFIGPAISGHPLEVGVDTDDLVEIDTDELKAIAQYADRRDRLETALTDAVRAARRNGRSWSEIGTMLGVSKQAAQRKYGKLAS